MPKALKLSSFQRNVGAAGASGLQERLTLNNVQVLRFVASLNVVLAHLLTYTKGYNTFDNRFFKYIVGWGENGVDIFFVISGFIMVYIQRHKNRKPISFFRDRVVRIVPVYWLVSLLFAALLFSFKTEVHEHYTIGRLIASLFFVSGLLGMKGTFLFVGWTLEFEMFFYLLFALSLYFRGLYRQIASVILLLILTVFFSHSYIMLEFVFGILIAVLFIRFDLRRFGWLFFLGGVIALCLSLSLNLNAIDRVIRWGIPAFFIVLGAVHMKQIQLRLLVELGNASYSTYLLHPVIIPLLFHALVFAGIYSFAGFAGNELMLLFLVMVILLVSWVFHRYCEKPMTELLKSKIVHAA